MKTERLPGLALILVDYNFGSGSSVTESVTTNSGQTALLATEGQSSISTSANAPSTSLTTQRASASTTQATSLESTSVAATFQSTRSTEMSTASTVTTSGLVTPTNVGLTNMPQTAAVSAETSSSLVNHLRITSAFATLYPDICLQ